MISRNNAISSPANCIEVSLDTVTGLTSKQFAGENARRLASVFARSDPDYVSSAENVFTDAYHIVNRYDAVVHVAVPKIGEVHLLSPVMETLPSNLSYGEYSICGISHLTALLKNIRFSFTNPPAKPTRKKAPEKKKVPSKKSKK